MRVWVPRASGFIAIVLAALVTAAELRLHVPVQDGPCVRAASIDSAPWARSFLRTRGEGAGAGLDAALTVIQTAYRDPSEGNVVLLLWSGATPGTELEVYVDGKSVGTVIDPGLAFVPEVSAGPHVFRVEAPSMPGSAAEGSIEVLEEQPFEDPSAIECGSALKDSDLTCSVEIAWTNTAPLPDYYLVFIDDGPGSTTDSGAATSITFERIPPGSHDVTVVGFLRFTPGSAQGLYRGSLLRAPCLIESCDPAPRFIRGACGGSGGNINISSAIFGLNFLFLGAEAPPCLAACDLDANGIIVITDSIYLLNYLFLGGPPPVGWVDEDGDGTRDPFCEDAIPAQCAIGQPGCASDS